MRSCAGWAGWRRSSRFPPARSRPGRGRGRWRRRFPAPRWPGPRDGLPSCGPTTVLWYTRAMTHTERDGVTLTHLDEPLFDGAGATKRDLVDYLDAMAGFILPELRDRPLSVIRGRAGQQPFMQKNVPDYAPPWMRTVTMWAES